MPVPASKNRPRPAAIVIVLALHGALLAGALHLGVWPDRTERPNRPPLTVQLIRQPPMAPQAAQTTHTPAKPVLAARSATPDPADRHRSSAAPPTSVPALQAITLPTAPPEPAGPPGAAASASAPTLNLALPRGASAPWRQRPLVLDDPRSNTPRLTLEQKLAMAMGGDGKWVEEVIDADHRRLRRGNLCVYMQRPAAAQLDPFHPANRNLPWQVSGQPTRCN